MTFPDPYCGYCGRSLYTATNREGYLTAFCGNCWTKQRETGEGTIAAPRCYCIPTIEYRAVRALETISSWIINGAKQASEEAKDSYSPVNES